MDQIEGIKKEGTHVQDDQAEQTDVIVLQGICAHCPMYLV